MTSTVLRPPARAAGPSAEHAVALGAVQRSPRAAAERLERAPVLPPGDDERLLGYGVMGVAFASGDILALRRAAASSIGGAFTSVWHRDPTGAWHIHTDRAPDESCPRYVGNAAASVQVGPIGLRWIDHWTLSVDVPHAALHWTVRSGDGTMSRVLDSVTAQSPGPTIFSRGALRLLAAMSRLALGTGPISLHGEVPSGQRYAIHPQKLWRVVGSSASRDGRDLGEMVTPREPIAIGPLRLPQRGLVMVAVARFSDR